MAPAIVGFGLDADGGAPAVGAAGHRARPSDLCDDPHQADQDQRRRRLEAHGAPVPPQLAPSPAGSVLPRAHRAGAAVTKPALLPAPSSQWVGGGSVGGH